MAKLQVSQSLAEADILKAYFTTREQLKGARTADLSKVGFWTGTTLAMIIKNFNGTYQAFHLGSWLFRREFCFSGVHNHVYRGS
jgi:hypothetical protein